MPPPPEKPPLTTHPSSLVSSTATLSGNHPITIGANTVIHPRATILSFHSPVEIGESCIINERAIVGIRINDDDGHGNVSSYTGNGNGKGTKTTEGEEEEDGERQGAAKKEEVVVKLGRGVVVEGKASVQGSVIGDWSVVGVGAVIGKGAVIWEVRCKILLFLYFVRFALLSEACHMYIYYL